MAALRLLARRRISVPATAGKRRALSPDEVHGALSEIGWGLLATEESGQPYAVPIAYGFDGRRIYIGTAPAPRAGPGAAGVHRNRVHDRAMFPLFFRG